MKVTVEKVKGNWQRHLKQLAPIDDSTALNQLQQIELKKQRWSNLTDGSKVTVKVPVEMDSLGTADKDNDLTKTKKLLKQMRRS